MRTFEAGSCLVANEVIDTVTALAASRVEGVSEVVGFDRKDGKLRRNYKDSLTTQTENGHIRAALTLEIDRDHKIVEVVQAVQEAVHEELESMFGLVCDGVDIIVR